MKQQINNINKNKPKQFSQGILNTNSMNQNTNNNQNHNNSNHKYNSNINSLEESLVDLYLSVKIRKQEEVNRIFLI